MHLCSCRKMTESSHGLHGVGFCRAARPFGETEKSTRVQLRIGERLLHPQQQLSDSCRALTADLLTTKTLRPSPCGWLPKRRIVCLPTYCSLNLFRSGLIYTQNYTFLMYFCRVNQSYKKKENKSQLLYSFWEFMYFWQP